MSRILGIVRTLSLSVFLAMIGFSYSLATSSNPAVAGFGVAVREVGTEIPLAFTNPFVAGPGSDRDLGDAVVGSILTRLVRAKGGVEPYTFTAGSLTAFSKNSLRLLADGLLTTVIGSQIASGLPSPFRFQVTVVDSFGTHPHSVTETFRLTFVNTNQFRFATTTLPDGLQYRAYTANIDTINGKAPITFSASGGLDGTGLSLAPDGTLFGTPTAAGTITFTATATDANTKPAAGRSGLGTSQSYTINIASNKTLAGVISATAITVKAGNGTSRDSVAYKGVANLGAASILDLVGKSLTLRIGSYTAPSVTFDGKGHAATARGVFPSVKATIRKGGLLSIAISKETINISGLTSFTINVPVDVRIENVASDAENLQFAVKAGRNGAETLTYKGAVSGDLGGVGQLLKVQGSDDRALSGDAWKVSFLARVPPALSTLGATSVSIAIGTSYVDDLALTNKNGKYTGKDSNKFPVISAFSLDTKGKGSFTTGVLPAVQTGIPTASTATTTNDFSTSVNFKNGTVVEYGFDSSLKIVPSRTKWVSQ